MSRHALPCTAAGASGTLDLAGAEGWRSALLGNPIMQTGMRVNWWGLLGERFSRRFGRVSSSEEISGITAGTSSGALAGDGAAGTASPSGPIPHGHGRQCPERDQ